MTGAEIAIAALIAAAVAATATTAYTGVTQGYDSVDDAFGRWISSFFTSFALSSAAGGAGAASGAESAGTDSGMWAGLTDQEALNLTAQSGVAGGTGTTAATTATAAGATAAPAASAVTAETMAMAEPLMGQGIDVATIAAEQSAAPQMIGQLDESLIGQIGNMFEGVSKFSPTNFLSKQAGITQSQLDMFNKYSDVSEGFSGLAQNSMDNMEYDRWKTPNYAQAFGGLVNPNARRGFNLGLDYEQSRQNPFKYSTEGKSSLGQSQDYNNWNYWEGF